MLHAMINKIDKVDATLILPVASSAQESSFCKRTQLTITVAFKHKRLSDLYIVFSDIFLYFKQVFQKLS